MIDLHQIRTKGFHSFVRVLFSRNSAYAKFRENKILTKISESTVYGIGLLFRVITNNMCNKV